MTRGYFGFFWCFVLAIVTVEPVAAQSPALDTAAIAAALEAELGATRSPGAAIAVVQGDRIVFETGIGLTSAEGDERITPATLFRVGSVTKMFTGLTAVSLARDGTLDLRAALGTYATGLHESLGSLTLHDLLSHMAGVTNEGADTGPHDDRALGERVRQWGTEHVFAPAGDVYSYTGPGYWLAGYALEQAGKGWYADLVAKRVLEPLGMVRSTFRPTMAMTYPVALDHRVQGERVAVLRPAPDDASTWPSGSLYSSARELARFAIAFMNGGMLEGRQALDREAIALMSTRHGGLPGEACGYTYGLSLCTRNGVRTLSHYGFRVGSGAVLTMAPDQRVAVIILSNRNGGIFGRTEAHVLDQLLPPNRAGRGGSGGASQPNAPTGRARAVFEGMYVNGGDTLRFTSRRDTLRYRYGATEMRTRPEGDSAVLILNDAGQPVQQFRLVRGLKSGNIYLHDGLNAFRREPAGRPAGAAPGVLAAEAFLSVLARPQSYP